MSHFDLYILGILFLNIAICEWLVSNTFFKHFGTALLVIALTAILANLGIIPSSTNSPELYDVIFTYIAPIAIFFLILECNISAIRAAGLPLLLMFLIGSLGTVVGVLIGGWLAGGSETIGSLFPQIAGMFTGTYTGGSINFNAVALEYDVNKEGLIYTGSVAIDNIWTAIWMIATIGLPKFLSSFLPRTKNQIEQGPVSEKDISDIESVHPFNISILVFLGAFAFMASEYFELQLLQWNIHLPGILILTTISLVLAQFPFIKSLKGSRVLGIIGIYLFLAVIGAYCDFSTLPQMGELAYHMFIFVAAVVIIHGLFTFVIGGLFKVDWDIVAIASQANVGGSGSALALARSLNRHDLLLPAILIATMGNAIGTYLGFLVVAFYL